MQMKLHYSFGICTTRLRNTIIKDKIKMVIQKKETTIGRINRLIGVDIIRCPLCRNGNLILVDIIPRSRSPTLLELNSLGLQG